MIITNRTWLWSNWFTQIFLKVWNKIIALRNIVLRRGKCACLSNYWVMFQYSLEKGSGGWALERLSMSLASAYSYILNLGPKWPSHGSYYRRKGTNMHRFLFWYSDIRGVKNHEGHITNSWKDHSNQSTYQYFLTYLNILRVLQSTRQRKIHNGLLNYIIYSKSTLGNSGGKERWQ